MSIVRERVTIRGTRELLMHHFTPDMLSDGSGERKAKTGSAGNDPEEWRKSCLFTQDGQAYLPHTYLFSCLVNGAKHTKKGRGSIQPTVAGTLRILDKRILLNRYFPGFPNGHAFDATKESPPPVDAEQPVYLDVCGVVNPATRGRNVRYRIGLCDGWEAEFGIAYDDTLVNPNQMRSVLKDAGEIVGLADGRRIGYGRFEVLESVRVP